MTGTLTMEAAEKTVRTASLAREAVRSSRRFRKDVDMDGSVVIHESEEFGKVELLPVGFCDTVWWFDLDREDGEWLVWYDGDGDVWEAAPQDEVQVCNECGVHMMRGCQAKRLHRFGRSTDGERA